MANSAVPDLDLHCLQMQGISGFSMTRVCLSSPNKKAINTASFLISSLMLSMLGKIKQTTSKYFSFFFSQKTGFDISCKLSPLETICMIYQILFSWKTKKNNINLLSAELAQRVTKG